MNVLKLFTAALFAGPLCVNAQDVVIPDANFKAALVANALLNTNSDTEIQLAEAQSYTLALNVNTKNIYDLTGIEAFVNIPELKCANNHIATMNTSSNTALQRLECGSNPLTSIDISGNGALTYFSFEDTYLTSLITSGNPNLKYLIGAHAPVASIDLSQNTELISVYFYHSGLTSIDVSSCTHLESLTCAESNITMLDVTHNPALYELNCSSNNISVLDLSANPDLSYLTCIENNLTSLNLSSNPALIRLVCFSNHLTSLDLSMNPALDALFCEDNNLLSLNVKNGHSFYIFGQNFSAYDNPMLNCIQVDDPDYCSTYWLNKDADAIYSLDCNAVGINAEKEDAGAVKVFPNPGNGFFVIQTEDKEAEFTVKNALGQIIYTEKMRPGNNEIDLGDQPGGVYLYELMSKDGSRTKGKIVVE